MKKVMAALVSAPVLITGSVWLVGGAAGGGSRFATHRVKVYFTREASLDKNCRGTKEFRRKTVGRDVLHDSLSWLLRGPRPAERKDGAASLFSAKTAGLINYVSIEDGTAYVDFDDFRKIIPEASSSCGSASLLAELKPTAKQFPTVERAVLSFEGSTKAFYNWLQIEPPG
jgi:hypothetical protein